ncbi:hypothetical protein niasHT_033175 [Heterodera trifolii]|uniref:ZP domain-containing protein n=1 Tax=Heterodera trifolii TaxID=157864 RepID=A0ABD2IJ04_9BILA
MSRHFIFLCLPIFASFLLLAFSDAQYIGGGAVPYPTENANIGGTYYSTPDTIDNEVVDTPAIRCTDRGVEFSINTRNPFRGNLYVQGEFGLAECRREFYNNEAPFASLEVRLGDCGMIREKRPHGMSYSLILITNFHPRFVTRVDRAYKIFCAYQQAERPVGVDLEVGSVPEESVSSDALMVPECEYTMRIGDLNGPPATGTVKVGDLIYHRWECQRSDAHGMLVKNCRVFDGGNDNVTLLDERGCPTHSGVIQSPPVYSDGLNMAFAPVFAFHFPDRTQMNFRCQIQTCNKLDNECQGLTPPNCQQNIVGIGATGGEGYSAPPTGPVVPYTINPPPTPNFVVPTLTSSFGVGAYLQQPMLQHSPFIGAGIAPSSPPNALPLDSVLQGNPSQVLQGLQRPWPRSSSSKKGAIHRAETRRDTDNEQQNGGEQQAGAGTKAAAPTAQGRREQMELEHRILMATQQLKHNEDGSWPPSLVIFGTGNKSAGNAAARRFFRPIPAEERELRQRQRRAEEHTQDVVAISTVINDGLHGLEWSNENGKTRVRPRDLMPSQNANNNKIKSSPASQPPSADEPMQCLNRSTLVALFAALGMLSAVVIAMFCYICWEMLISNRRCCLGKGLVNWRPKGVSCTEQGTTIFGGRQKTSAFEVPSVFTHPISNLNIDNANVCTLPTNTAQQTERSVQEEEVQAPQAILAGILNSNLYGNAYGGRRAHQQSAAVPPNVRR